MLLGVLSAHQILLIFLGSFFFGDTVLLSLALAAANGIVSIQSLLIFSFLGTIISDTIWFYAGKYLYMKTYKKNIQKHRRLLASIDRLTGRGVRANNDHRPRNNP